MEKIRCIIVDDEALAREGMEQLVEEFDFLELVGSFKNAMSAQTALQQHTVDLMFLDINMPRITGLAFLEALSNPPITILTTAYAEYALDGFRLDVLDYLLKPISPERFLKAVNKARDYLLLQHAVTNKTSVPGYIFLKNNQALEKVMLNEIVFLEGMQNYIHVYTTTKKFTVHISMKAAEETLQTGNFMRVHKSFVVNLDFIQLIEGNIIRVPNHEIPVSRALRDALMEKVVANNLLSRDAKK
ncbi:LytTR family two component transcriptional regulator [Chitinophaga skermanii]|uniref:LytTR family two component transcriptional regulator n=1 Tax=Chitinophaga skermanii TaxID=331697 RepID=A0A327Q4S6_9BACT|nr:LytTR family DNA-binding domain-containing protein [Chitinophaga skermanii]RAI98731.1 LytTR family two component transcriptional regulator [Chitinophaga skermanii]